MPDLEIVAGLPLSIVVMGLVAAAREAGMPQRYAPAVSLALGIVLAVLAHVTGTVVFSTWFAAFVTGISSGLMASGLYSSTKKYAENAQEKAAAE